MRTIRLAVLLLAATSAFASPVITSVTPSEGPVFGGTRVVIRGSGFSDVCIVCSPPFSGLSVFFGGTPALDVDFIDSTTVEAITPAHLPGTVGVTVRQLDGSNPNEFTLPNAFTFTGESFAAFEPVLFPIFLGPVRGAFGSEFHTTARAVSRGEPLDIYGVDTNCTSIDPPLLPTNPFRIGATPVELPVLCSRSVGRLFYVADERSADFVTNLRVADVSRTRESHGVEIPVVRGDDFTTGRIVLMGVPIDARYRNTLRIYGLHTGSQFVNVTVNGVTRGVALQRGETIFEPTFATFTDFPAQPASGPITATVVIEDPLGGRGIVPPTPVWAMISVTNNDTQQITTITPN
ncbi:MAG TPA: IPT/TIG domain-containing protein [Thermoanaerobaculia bacterium]|nr:IPT/TIG domain-containing protein [Thermoanaerobaculia bacterium]